MSQLSALKEHVFHLIDACTDEKQLVRCIRILESASQDIRGSMLAVSSQESEGLSLVIDEDFGASHEEEDDRHEAEAQVAKEGRRIAVSAAPVALSAVRDFNPRVVPKTPSEEEVVRSGVQACHLFANMEADEREVVVKALEKEEFDAGIDVLKQGGPPRDKFYLITEGTCEVIKNGKHVASLSGGATFGELEMMYKQSECAATIRCVTNCTMYSLDQLSYQHIVLNVSIQKREKYERLLHRVSFLESLSDYDRMTIAEALVTTEYRQDEKIITFGEKGQWMHIVVEGEVQVVGRNRGKKVDVVRLGEGNVVGELEFLFDHLTVADVVAATSRVVTAKINRKHFEMVMGPISEELKKFVAKKGNYSHYLAEADEKVKAEITMLEKRVRRVAKQQGEVLENLDKDGEIVIPDPSPPDASVGRGAAHRKEAVYRFPLKPVQDANFIMIGLREDGVIVMWNEAMSRATNYQTQEVCGQSFYSFLHNVKDQEVMHNAINTARSYTGNIDGFYQAMADKEKDTFVFARSDGLTKATLQLTVIPPVVAQGRDVADILLAIGHEVKRPPPMKQGDYSHWITDQVRTAINDTEVNTDEKLSRIGGLITKFEGLVKGSNFTTEELRVVNVRQLIGQVIMDYGAVCVEKNLAVKQSYDDVIGFSDSVYCDAHLLPECLRYAMSNCCNHIGRDCTIRIKVGVEELFGSEQLVIAFSDNGPGFPAKVIEEFNNNVNSHYTALLRVKAAVEKQGGTMSILSVPGDTQVIFRIPFIPQEEEEDAGISEVPPDLGGSLATHSSSVFVKKQNYTTLVVEDTPAHRNMLCAFLWERKHAVLPAYSLNDINRLTDVTDILIIDPQQSVLSDPTVIADPFAMLREKARHHAVIVTSPSFDESTKKAYQAAGFFTLQKPCTAIQAVQVLRKAEEKISKIKSEAEKIAQTRDTLAKNSRGAWKKGQMLGKGAFGEVYEAIDVLTGGKMAVKMMRVTEKMNKNELLHEIEVMCTLQHPNIIHYFYCEDNTEMHTINVFMEYAAGGTLQGLLTKKGKLDFKEFQSLLRDVVEGIAYIHKNRYVHCDIKTANVLLNYEGKGKIGDFGTAKQLKEDEELFEMQGSPLYMSPECMSAGEMKEDGSGGRIGYSFPSDIWSLGCVVMEMATNKPPFSHIEINGPMGLMSFVTGLTDIPDLSPLFEHPPSVIEFVSACLHPDPAKRPTAQSLLSYSIFNETTDDDMKSALKALKRAQLLHVLNKFVAFQDEEEMEQQKKDQARFKTARRDSAFFDSSDDDDDGEDSQTKHEKNEAAFFESSDDEDEDDDGDANEKEKDNEGTKKQEDAKVPATQETSVANSSAAPSVAVTMEHNLPNNTDDAEQQKSNEGSAPRTPVRAAPSRGRQNLFAVDEHQTPPSFVPVPPPPKRAAEEPTPSDPPTPVVQPTAAFEQEVTLPPPAVAPEAHDADRRKSSKAHVEFAVPRPPSQDPAFAPLSPHHHRLSHDSPAIAAHQRHQVIILHDALLALVEELKKLNTNVEATDSLLKQYHAATTPAAAAGVSIVASTSSSSGSGNTDEKPTAPSSQDPGRRNFVPNVEQLLKDDTEVIRTLIATLTGQQQSSTTPPMP